LAQPPDEQAASIQVPVPLELPKLPPGNPFRTAASQLPKLADQPLARKHNLTFTAQAALYVGSTGEVLRVVVLDQAIPDTAGEIYQDLAKAKFRPARQLGSDVPVWLNLQISLAGTVKKGTVRGVKITPVPEGEPPVPEQAQPPQASPRDKNAPTTSLADLDRLPEARSLNVSVGGKIVRARLRLLLNVDAAGRCARLLQLSGPPGLNSWILASAGSWTFEPGRDAEGTPVPSWILMDLEVEVQTSSWKMRNVQVMREPVYP